MGGMGPCLGLLVYDHDTRGTHGGHFPSPLLMNSDDLQEMLNSAAKTYAHSAAVSIFLGGCCVADIIEGKNNTIDGKSALVVRTQIEGQISMWATANWSVGTVSIIQKWPAPNECGTNLSILPDVGTVDTE